MKKIICILLLAALLAGSVPSVLFVSAAPENNSATPDEKLFSSSFEKSDPSPLLSTPDGDFCENLLLVERMQEDVGLQVDISTVYGSDDYVSNESTGCSLYILTGMALTAHSCPPA